MRKTNEILIRNYYDDEEDLVLVEHKILKFHLRDSFLVFLTWTEFFITLARFSAILLKKKMLYFPLTLAQLKESGIF